MMEMVLHMEIQKMKCLLNQQNKAYIIQNQKNKMLHNINNNIINQIWKKKKLKCVYQIII